MVKCALIPALGDGDMRSPESWLFYGVLAKWWDPVSRLERWRAVEGGLPASCSAATGAHTGFHAILMWTHHTHAHTGPHTILMCTHHTHALFPLRTVKMYTLKDYLVMGGDKERGFLFILLVNILKVFVPRIMNDLFYSFSWEYSSLLNLDTKTILVSGTLILSHSTIPPQLSLSDSHFQILVIKERSSVPFTISFS